MARKALLPRDHAPGMIRQRSRRKNLDMTLRPWEEVVRLYNESNPGDQITLNVAQSTAKRGLEKMHQLVTRPDQRALLDAMLAQID